MSNDNEALMPPVDRKTASKINPAIADIGAWGTCSNVSNAMRALG